MNQPITAVFTACFIFCALSYSSAQPASNEVKRNYAKEPYWIAMMADTNTNYFEAIEAYDAFWANRPKPREEEDVLNKFDRESPKIEEERSFLYKLFHAKEMREEKEMEQYAFQCKKFEHWKQVNWPYVQPDGRILTPHEQMEIWREQRGSEK